MQSLISSPTPTMSSREIADLTGSSHDNVLKTVRALRARGVVSGNDTPYVHPQNGQTYTEIRLDYRDTMVIVSGYSVELRARIIDRWQELEAAAASPKFSVPQTMSEALRLAADQAAEIEHQNIKIAALAHKAEFHDSIERAVNALPIGEVAQEIGTGEKRLFAWLRRAGYLKQDNLPYQDKIEQDLFVVKPKAWRDNDGSEHVYSQTLVTGKGLIRISRFFNEEVARLALRLERAEANGDTAETLRVQADLIDRYRNKAIECGNRREANLLDEISGGLRGEAEVVQ